MSPFKELFLFRLRNKTTKNKTRKAKKIVFYENIAKVIVILRKMIETIKMSFSKETRLLFREATTKKSLTIELWFNSTAKYSVYIKNYCEGQNEVFEFH